MKIYKINPTIIINMNLLLIAKFDLLIVLLLIIIKIKI